MYLKPIPENGNTKFKKYETIVRLKDKKILIFKKGAIIFLNNIDSKIKKIKKILVKNVKLLTLKFLRFSNKLMFFQKKIIHIKSIKTVKIFLPIKNISLNF